MRQVLVIRNKWAEKRFIMPVISETDCTMQGYTIMVLQRLKRAMNSFSNT